METTAATNQRDRASRPLAARTRHSVSRYSAVHFAVNLSGSSIHLGKGYRVNAVFGAGESLKSDKKRDKLGGKATSKERTKQGGEGVGLFRLASALTHPPI